MMPSKTSIIFVLGCPGAGKTTLSTLLSKDFPVRHISVGNLLRRIKNDTAHPQAGALASKLDKQELIDGNLLIPILRSELEKLEMTEPGGRAVLMDGFPRNLEQLRVFEAEIAEPVLVWVFNCPKEIAEERYLNRNLEGRQTDDATMFAKRYGDFVQENEKVVREYRERKTLMEFDTSFGTKESLAKLHVKLRGHVQWLDIIGSC